MGRTDKHFHLWMHKDVDALKLYLIKVIGVTILIFLSVFAWGYVLRVHDEVVRRILFSALTANGIVLAGNLILYVGLYGYRDGFKRHVLISCLMSTVITTIELYILKVGLVLETDIANAGAFPILLQFGVYLLISAVLALVPSFFGLWTDVAYCAYFWKRRNECT